jgi:hypothetical protein
VRLGLRLTLRQNGKKPAGSQTEDQSAARQGEAQPAADQPDDQQNATSAEDRTESFPAISMPGDVPALSHEEYLPGGAGTEAEKSAGGGTGDGSASVEADMPPARNEATSEAAGHTAAMDWAADPAAAEAAEAAAGSEVADQPAGSRTDADTGSLPATAMPGDVPPGSHEEYVPAASLDEALAAASAHVDGGAPAAARTAVFSGLARQWDQLGLGRRAGGLWQRGVVTPWQRTIGRLGISRLWQPGPGVREAADPGTRTLALVTALPVILLVAWLVPGLVLLLVHAFLPAPVVLISVPLAVALTILVARELPGRWPVPEPADTTDTAAAGARPAATAQPVAGARGGRAKKRARPWAAWWGLLGSVAIAAAFAVWQLVENSPQLIVSRDPGAFAQFAYWIADHGSLPIPTSAAAFGGAHPGLTFASFGFAAHSGAVVPGLAPGLPIVLAAGMWAHGVSGAIALSPVIGALAILAVAGLTARLAGPQWAPAGALLLAITVPEIYTSRSAFSDTLAQALLFGGLALAVDSFSSRRRITLASLGGLALGLTVLAGTSFLLLLLPMIVVAGALLAGRKPQAIPLAAGWLAGVVAGLATDVALDASALSTTTPSFRIIGALAAGLAVVTAAGVAIALIDPARRSARKLLAARPLRWLPEAGAALVILAGIGLVIRPYLQKVHGPASPYVAALQRLEGLPVDAGRLYAENSLYWVIWYIGVPVLLLGLIGLAMVTRMCVRALITWRDPTGEALSWVLPASIIGWGLFAVLWQPGTVPDQPWASRQLVPVVLPGLIVLAVWVAAWMIGLAHARGAGRLAVALATACFVVAMGVPPAAITFGIELSQPADPATRLALSGLAFHATGAGEVAAVEQLCGAIPPHSSVVLLDKVAARAFAQVIRGTCGVPTGIVTSTAPGNVAAVIGGIERAGRHPALLATKAAELTPYGASSRQIVNLATQQDEHLLTRPPTSTWPVRYSLWMSQPVGTAIGA